MQTINSSTALKTAIAELEIKQAAQAAQIGQQFTVIKEIIKPVNLIKNVFHQVAESDEIKDNVLNTGIGIGAGYLSKVLFEGATHSAARKFLGTILMFGVSNFTAKHSIHIKAAALTIIDTVIENLPRKAISGPEGHQPE